MKSIIKKSMAIAILLVAVVGWPIEGEASAGRVVVKGASCLFRSCVKKSTQVAEKEVAKSTQVVEKTVNSAISESVQNPRTQTAAFRAVQRSQNRTNAQAASQPRFYTCPTCCGGGAVQGRDGYVYSCSTCKGTGRIFK